MRNILTATVALALLSFTGMASAQNDYSRNQREDRYSRDRYDRDSSYRRNSSAEARRNAIWRELFTRQEDERREFYRCTNYRRGSREYNRALDCIVERQEQERCEMRERLVRENRSYRDR